MEKAAKLMLAIILPLLIVCTSSVLIFIWHIRHGGVVLDPEHLNMQENSQVLAADGSLLLSLSGEENRILVSLDEVSPCVVQALLATEDRSFYEHHGVDGRAVIRAYIANRQAGKIVQGGSTITQQLVKLCYLSPEQNMKRKLQEAYLALLFEQQYSKKEILEYYLNNVYFGTGAYGIEEAARVYFGKNAMQLDEREGAYLIALLRAPHYYASNEDAARNRCQQVLAAMHDCGCLQNIPTIGDMKIQKNLPVYRGDYLSDYAIEEAESILGYAVPGRGLTIETCIDPELQAGLRQYFADARNFPSDKGGQMAQGAAVLLDAKSGSLIGMVGGRDYQVRGFNRAVHSLRQPGSALKPVLVYAPALQRGMKPDDYLEDQPASYVSGDGKRWSPQNYDHRYRGNISMREALKWSVNTCAVALLNEQGPVSCIDLAEQFGISSFVKEGSFNDCTLAAALGGLTKGVSPLEMAGAYAVFARGGSYIKPHVVNRIVDSKGNILYEFTERPRVVLTTQEALQMTDMLVDVVYGGTGTRARIPGVDLAGKTGTSETLRDAWFIGYSPSVVCAVWMGYDKGLNMNGVAGGDQPARLFKKLLSHTLQYRGIKEEHFAGLPPRKQRIETREEKKPGIDQKQNNGQASGPESSVTGESLPDLPVDTPPQDSLVPPPADQPIVPGQLYGE